MKKNTALALIIGLMLTGTITHADPPDHETLRNFLEGMGPDERGVYDPMSLRGICTHEHILFRDYSTEVERLCNEIIAKFETLIASPQHFCATQEFFDGLYGAFRKIQKNDKKMAKHLQDVHEAAANNNTRAQARAERALNTEGGRLQTNLETFKSKVNQIENFGQDEPCSAE
ncbi:MAG: hypothetical protein HYT79_09405 [Elusimicrobia bacterium]|nr:hypothetical protein [Elusimicrobiota bacterium]